MKRLLLFTALVVLTGCNHPEKGGDENEATQRMQKGVTFNPKFGLMVPTETAGFIGLEVVDVQEQEMGESCQFWAHVYSAAADGKKARASGMVSQADASWLKKAELRITKGGAHWKGQVVGVDAQLRAPGGLVEALIELEDPGKALSPGDQVMAEAVKGSKKKVVSVPREALLETVEGSFVYTLSGERFVRTTVKTGTRTKEDVEITDGLYAGDQVAKKPVMTLWLAELQSLRGGQACGDGH